MHVCIPIRRRPIILITRNTRPIILGAPNNLDNKKQTPKNVGCAQYTPKNIGCAHGFLRFRFSGGGFFAPPHPLTKHNNRKHFCAPAPARHEYPEAFLCPRSPRDTKYPEAFSHPHSPRHGISGTILATMLSPKTPYPETPYPETTWRTHDKCMTDSILPLHWPISHKFLPARETTPPLGPSNHRPRGFLRPRPRTTRSPGGIFVPPLPRDTGSQ